MSAVASTLALLDRVADRDVHLRHRVGRRDLRRRRRVGHEVRVRAEHEAVALRGLDGAGRRDVVGDVADGRVAVRYAVGAAALAVRPPIATQMAPIPTAPSTSTATIFVFIPLLWIRDGPSGAQAPAATRPIVGGAAETRLRTR